MRLAIKYARIYSNEIKFSVAFLAMMGFVGGMVAGLHYITRVYDPASSRYRDCRNAWMRTHAHLIQTVDNCAADAERDRSAAQCVVELMTARGASCD